MLGRFIGPALGLGTNPPVYVTAAAVLLFITLVLVARMVVNAFPGNKPPILESIPFIGGLLGFLDSPLKLARHGFEKYGEVS